MKAIFLALHVQFLVFSHIRCSKLRVSYYSTALRRPTAFSGGRTLLVLNTISGSD